MRYTDFLKQSKLDLNKYIFDCLIYYLNLKFLKQTKKLINTSILKKIRKKISSVKTILNFNK